MSRSSHHHFIPRFHLRQFSREDLVAVYVKNMDAIVPRQPVSHTAVRSGFHVVRTARGRSDVIERAIGTIENAAAPILTQLATGPTPGSLSRTERRLLARYIGTLYLRVPSQRELLSRLQTEFVGQAGWPGLTRQHLDRSIDAINLTQSEEEADAWRTILGYLIKGQQEVVDAHSSLQGIALGGLLAEDISMMEWTVYRRVLPPYFVLPDRPVVGCKPRQEEGPSWFAVALGANALLVMEDTRKPSLRELSADAPDPMLRKLWQRSFPTMYSGLDDPVIFNARLAWWLIARDAIGRGTSDLSYMRGLFLSGSATLASRYPAS
jgi:Protein of unknown function (DUF4238)